MGNGVNRLFNVMKKTSDGAKTASSKLVSLKVKSINPLTFQLDDRLDITEEFCYFSNSADKDLLNVGDVVVAVALNEGQTYYIQHNLDGLLTTVAELNFLQGATDNIQHQLDIIKTSGVATGDTLPIGTVVEFSGDEVPENWEAVDYNESIISPDEPTTGQEIWFQKSKNIINTLHIQNISSYGVTIVRNNDGTLTFNGTCTSGFNLVLLKGLIGKLLGTYTFSIRILSGTMTGGSIRLSLNNKGSNSSVNTASRLATVVINSGGNFAKDTQDINDTAYYLPMYINTGCVFTNCVIAIQLEVGTDASDYKQPVINSILLKNDNGRYEEFMETDIVVSPTEPTTGEKIWIQQSDNLFNKNDYIIDRENFVGFNIELEAGETYTLSSNKPLTVAKFAAYGGQSDNTQGPERWASFTEWTFKAEGKAVGKIWNRLFLGVANDKLSTNYSDFADYEIQITKGTSKVNYSEFCKNEIYIKNNNNIYEKLNIIRHDDNETLLAAINGTSTSVSKDFVLLMNKYKQFAIRLYMSWEGRFYYFASAIYSTALLSTTASFQLRNKKWNDTLTINVATMIKLNDWTYQLSMATNVADSNIYFALYGIE